MATGRPLGTFPKNDQMGRTPEPFERTVGETATDAREDGWARRDHQVGREELTTGPCGERMGRGGPIDDLIEDPVALPS
jgi:hypothetical protein